MEKTEIRKILSYLHTAYPLTAKEWGNTERVKEIEAVWHDILKVFSYQVAQEAAKGYIQRGGKFFPSIGEFTILCDEIWNRQIDEDRNRKQQQEREDDMSAYRKLFHDPVDGFADDYAKKSVILIRDVCEGRIKYNSPDWKERFEGIYGKEVI